MKPQAASPRSAPPTEIERLAQLPKDLKDAVLAYYAALRTYRQKYPQ